MLLISFSECVYPAEDNWLSRRLAVIKCDMISKSLDRGSLARTWNLYFFISEERPNGPNPSCTDNWCLDQKLFEKLHKTLWKTQIVIDQLSNWLKKHLIDFSHKRMNSEGTAGVKNPSWKRNFVCRKSWKKSEFCKSDRTKKHKRFDSCRRMRCKLQPVII